MIPIDEEVLLTTITDNLLGGREVIVRIRTLQKMYIKRIIRLTKPYYIEINPASISSQIKNYLTNKKFIRTKGSPSGWVINRKLLKRLCKKYDIEVYPVGTV